ncbi:MAG: sarcosine oxidase subunit delta [Caldilineaceae bacterium]
MSIQLPCPHCGPRPLEEFIYGEVPVVPDTITDPDARDLDRAFMRTNSEGPTTERWFHTYGCRRWLTLQRDTRTNDILLITK